MSSTEMASVSVDDEDWAAASFSMGRSYHECRSQAHQFSDGKPPVASTHLLVSRGHSATSYSVPPGFPSLFYLVGKCAS